MAIRIEEQKDWAAVHVLNETAFETSVEANIVDSLREQVKPFVSLVAELNDEIIGHIMFSPVSLSGHPEAKVMGLAPMAVAPNHQREGIGSELVNIGFEHCKQLGFGAVVVLGHPQYYPRFGFLPSSHFEIGSEYEVPEDVFMAIELQPGYLHNKLGIIKYHTAFNEV